MKGAAPPPGHVPPINDTRCSEPECQNLARSFWRPWCERHMPVTQMDFVEITGHVDEGSRW